LLRAQCRIAASCSGDRVGGIALWVPAVRVRAFAAVFFGVMVRVVVAGFAGAFS